MSLLYNGTRSDNADAIVYFYTFCFHSNMLAQLYQLQEILIFFEPYLLCHW